MRDLKTEELVAVSGGSRTARFRDCNRGRTVPTENGSHTIFHCGGGGGGSLGGGGAALFGNGGLGNTGTGFAGPFGGPAGFTPIAQEEETPTANDIAEACGNFANGEGSVAFGSACFGPLHDMQNDIENLERQLQSESSDSDSRSLDFFCTGSEAALNTLRGITNADMADRIILEQNIRNERAAADIHANCLRNSK